MITEHPLLNDLEKYPDNPLKHILELIDKVCACIEFIPSLVLWDVQRPYYLVYGRYKAFLKKNQGISPKCFFLLGHLNWVGGMFSGTN